MAGIQVLLVDDHTILREGLRALLKDYADITVVGDARSGEEAVAETGVLLPDIVLMDILMPRMSGLEATQQIRERYPRTRVLVLTQFEDQQMVLSLLRAGASGYVLKRAMGRDLVTAIRAVHEGGTFLGPGVTVSKMEGASGDAAKDAKPLEALTDREREVLTLIARGQTTSRIAETLSVSASTIVYHRANLMGKLGIHKATDLVRYALQHGLVQ